MTDHRGCIQTYFSLYDEKKKRYDIYRRKSHSFVIGFMGALSLAFEGAATTTATYTNTAGGTHTLAQNAINLFCGAPATVTTYGIVVGSGTTAPTPSDTNMTTLITNGMGAGQLEYGACVASDGIVSGPNVQFTITRGFTNGSGGSVTVNEIGLVSEIDQSIVGLMDFLVIHDLLTVVFNNGDIKTGTYTIVGTT